MFDDQKAKKDKGKPQIHLVPMGIINAIANVREFGTYKYGDSENWKSVDVMRYYNAAMRHMMTWLEKVNNYKLSIDDESGLDHLWHTATNLAFMIELQAAWQYERYQKHLLDTKPPIVPAKEEITKGESND